MAFENLGEYDQARKQYEGASEVDAEDNQHQEYAARALAKLGCLLFLQYHKPTEALAALRKSTALFQKAGLMDTFSIAALINMSYIYHQRRDFRSEKDTIAEALRHWHHVFGKGNTDLESRLANAEAALAKK
jgi:hypothetical protein